MRDDCQAYSACCRSGTTIDTDFKRESRDTPRIANLGIEIKGQLDEMKKRLEAKGVVYA